MLKAAKAAWSILFCRLSLPLVCFWLSCLSLSLTIIFLVVVLTGPLKWLFCICRQTDRLTNKTYDLRAAFVAKKNTQKTTLQRPGCNGGVRAVLWWDVTVWPVTTAQFSGGPHTQTEPPVPFTFMTSEATNWHTRIIGQWGEGRAGFWEHWLFWQSWGPRFCIL